MALALRLAAAGDLPALASIYRETAQALGPWCYTPAQVAAWARFADSPSFAAYVFDAETWVACDDRGQVIGFSGASTGGEVHSLYVRHDRVRQGIGSQLLAHVLACGRRHGVQRFSAWATPFSRPVFARAGFVPVETVHGEFEGVMFERYRVALELQA